MYILRFAGCGGTQNILESKKVHSISLIGYSLAKYNPQI
jgi:hypothetical protein